MASPVKKICPFGHSTRPGQTRCPVCGELLINERRREERQIQSERRVIRARDARHIKPTPLRSLLRVERPREAPTHSLGSCGAADLCLSV